MATVLGPDRQQVVDILDRAVADSGMSMRGFAGAMGTSASRFSAYRTGKSQPSAAFVFRAARIAASLKESRRARLPVPSDAVVALASARTRGDEDRVLAVALEVRDRLEYAMDTHPAAVAAWEARPPLADLDTRWTVLLAALVGRCFEVRSRTPPSWTDEPCLDEPWVLDSFLLTDDEVVAQTPRWLARRNVFAAPRDLVTV